MIESMDHERASELLPWLVNETLSGNERASVEHHVASCVTCRAALKQQQRLAALVAQQDTVHLSAAAGFRELMQRIDARPKTPAPLRRGARAIMAAAALTAIAMVSLFWVGQQGNEQARFRTLSQDPAAAHLYLDVIFAAGVDDSTMQRVFQELNASVVSGPSALGRYTLRIEVDAAEQGAFIDRISADERIRFAGRSFQAAE